MKKSQTFLVNSIILIFTSLITRIISSLFDIYIANKIGSETLGVFGLISSIYFFGITIASSGINLSTTKVMSEELESNSNVNTKYILKISIFFSFITGVLSCIILSFFAPYITKEILYSKVSNLVIYILALSLPFIALSLSLSSYFLAKRNVLSSSINQIATQFVRIIVVFITLNILAKDINSAVLCLVLGTTISEIASLVFHYLVYLKESKSCVSANLTKPKKLHVRMLKIAIPIAITSYIRAGLNSIKHVLIPLRLKLTGMSYELALQNYGIITGMAMPIIMFGSVIIYSFSSLLVPEFSRYSVSDKKKEMGKDIHKLFKITLYFSIGLTGILMYFGNEIGYLVYNHFKAGHYIKLIAPLIPLIYLDNVIDNILKGLGKQVNVMICNIIDMIVSISFIYFSLPKLGIVGYILVMYISEILNYTISVLTLFKYTNIKFKYFEWVILPILCIILTLILSNIILTNLFAQILLSITLYITFIFLFAFNLSIL